MKYLNLGITAPKGFSAAGCAAGVKAKQKKDISLLYAGAPCVLAAAFTTNLVQAAPVRYNKAIYESGRPVRAVVINSGVANACTGKEGEENAAAMAKKTADCLGVAPEEVLVNSTGVIGVQLPMEKIEAGIEAASKALGAEEQSAADASMGILTTDTFPKTVCVELEIDGVPVRIAAMAKGSGMIHPNMATMLSFITTDAAIDQEDFRALLKESILDSYNMMSVDGDTSTNDSVLALASGLAGNPVLKAGTPQFARFKEAFDAVNVNIARQIARDGEGATKLITARVSGAKTKEDARKIALSVIKSSLVKTAIFGADANWGRVLCAMGYSGGDFDPDQVVLSFESAKGKILLFEKGVPLNFDESKALEILQEEDIYINIDLGEGTQSAQSFGCDLTYDYVKINGEYRS